MERQYVRRTTALTSISEKPSLSIAHLDSKYLTNILTHRSRLRFVWGDVVGSFEINEVADYYGKIVNVSEDKVFYEDGLFDYLPTVTEGIDEYGEESFLKIIDDSRTEVGE